MKRIAMGTLGLGLCAGLIMGSAAKARDFAAEATYWQQTKPIDLTTWISNSKCYSSPPMLWACVSALNAAGALFTPQLHLTSDGSHIAMNKDSNFLKGHTWFEFYHNLVGQAFDNRAHVYQTFKVQNNSEKGDPQRFDFAASIEQMRKDLPDPWPQQMLNGFLLNGYLRAFDPHAYVLPRAQFEYKQTNFSKKLIGVGLNLDFLSQGVLIHHVFPNSPAAHSGLIEDDQILALAPEGDGQFISAASLDPAEFYDLIPGRPGSKISFRIQRQGQDRPFEIQIARGKFEIPAFEGRLIDSTTGYMVLRNFELLDACSLVGEKVQQLVSLGATKLILDLRGNAGGSETMAVCIAGLFIGDRKVVERIPLKIAIPNFPEIDTPSFMQETQWLSGFFAPLWNGPIVVLIDSLSASSSEIVAGAMQDQLPNAWVVGSRSAGKGTVQLLSTAKDNDTLEFARTIARYQLPSHRSPQRVGVLPNFEVPSRPGASLKDQFLPREEDFYPMTLAAEDPPWVDPRKDQAEVLKTCAGPSVDRHLEETRFEASSRVDYQLAYAISLLDCLD